ncbi:hypothetical protein [Candidatus Poriferisocius sp.]|uniref:hypothetical protein n=1 Tax=Candidatus Poriferisocius sp. TaxID=3101276 RepID=UPI003B029380
MPIEFAKLNKTVTITAVLALHWSVFWLLNGLDKFLNTDNFFGVDFKNKLKGPPDQDGLLANLGLGDGWAAPIAAIVGIIELVLALLFVGALVSLARRKADSSDAIAACLTLSILFFAILSAGAVLFGDRAAMEQHGIFIIALLASRVVVGKTAANA